MSEPVPESRIQSVSKLGLLHIANQRQEFAQLVYLPSGRLSRTGIADRLFGAGRLQCSTPDAAGRHGFTRTVVRHTAFSVRVTIAATLIH